MGNLSVAELTIPNGSSILNATLDLNYDRLSFGFPDETVGIKVDMTIKESLFSMEDRIDGRKAFTCTFFGDVSGVFTSDMIPYMGINSSPTINMPFIVQIELPSSYYFSTSQPPPIEYYIKQNNRWIMFSMDFLNGSYAQTIVCNFEDPAFQPLRDLLIFLIGIFSTLSITSGLDTWKHYKEKENSDPE
jgi:hypothetical protein